MASLASPYKQEDLDLDLWNPHKRNPDMVTHTCNLSSGEVEIQGSQALAGQPD